MKRVIDFFRREKIWGHRLVLILMDLFMTVAAGLLAFLVRFEFSWSSIDPYILEEFRRYLPVNLVVTIVIFWIFRLYHSLWQLAGSEEMANIIAACVAAEVLDILEVWGMKAHIPRSYYFLKLVFLIMGTIGIRFCYRYFRTLKRKIDAPAAKNVMVIGGGVAGTMIIKEIRDSHHLNGRVKCIIDDDKNKIGCYIHGVRIVGNRDTILENVKKYQIDMIIIAMPSQSQKSVREILNICKETGCKLKILPGIYQLVNDEVKISRLRDVDINDLLGRDPVVINDEEVQNWISGKTILVTGGGGSIGSELCRQIAAGGVRRLIIFDIYENNAYDIQQELQRTYPDLDLVVLIGSVRNTKRINDVIETYRPQIIFHAAAHKHVPLMENSPDEAIKNNVMGTLKTVQAADRWGVERFVLISTDKAVNPTNIMGASKRLCEMIIQMYNSHSKTEFVAVRFGNVLGSNGSVIPLFQKQIASGGPVTVTDPEIIRYFMTIPEAVSLVLQAGVYGKGGEIFVLDMGEPVKILDLAKNLIRLSGLVPGEDIKIVFTGLRPGEKLYEELLMDEEGLQKTSNKLIYIGNPISFDESEFKENLEELKRAAEGEAKDIRKMVQKMVPTYNPEGQE